MFRCASQWAPRSPSPTVSASPCTFCVCISIAALRMGSSAPSFWMPYCASLISPHNLCSTCLPGFLPKQRSDQAILLTYTSFQVLPKACRIKCTFFRLIVQCPSQSNLKLIFLASGFSGSLLPFIPSTVNALECFSSRPPLPPPCPYLGCASRMFSHWKPAGASRYSSTANPSQNVSSQPPNPRLVTSFLCINT